MRWFKHMSDLKRDEGVSRYLESNKLAGYGFLMLVLETVAERMDLTSDRCAATYSRAEWARITRSTIRSVDRHLVGLELIDWINVSATDEGTTVDVPRLVDWRDEYTHKKSRRTPDSVRTISHRGEEEKIRTKVDQTRSFDEIKRKVNSVLTSKLAEPGDIQSISRLTGSTLKQTQAAVNQLLNND